jgi:hypothetical protein
MDPVRFFPVSEVQWTPTSTSTPVPAQLTIHGDAWILLLPPDPMPTAHRANPATFTKFLASLDTWESELFPELHMEVDCYAFLHRVDSQVLADTAI